MNREIETKEGKEHLFDKPRNVKRLLGFFYTLLLLLLIIDFFIHKHPYFPWEGSPQFYAVFGFVVCVALIFVAKYILRPIVKRKEDYYD